MQERTASLVRKSPERHLSLAAKEALWGYGFISPWIVGLIVFTAGPILASLYLSFTRYTVLRPPVWVGTRNYVRAFTDDRLFWTSLVNTGYYTLLSVPLRIFTGFLLAILLNTKIRGMTVFRSLYYLPSIVPVVATSMLWLFIFMPHLGLADYVLALAGMRSPGWLQSTTWSKPTLIFISMWSVGQGMVIYLAGLQDVPQELYEAADIDGAGMWRKFINITIPMVSPTIFFNLVMGVIGAFQVFSMAYIMTDGGPMNSTLFFNLYTYRNAFVFLQMGYASMLSWVLFIFVLILTVLIFKSSVSWVYYET
jgi:multiple sugar transport system permease protein